MAALLTQVSMRPNRCTAAAARACTWSHSATSVTTARARPPARSLSAAAFSRASRLRAARTTAAPFSQRSAAVARPMPDEAPVTTTTWSRSGLVMMELSSIHQRPDRFHRLEWGGGKIDTDVAIVGAGPAGSALAIMLGRMGMRTVLLDRSRFPRDKACGEGLMPAGVAVLEGIGVPLDSFPTLGGVS